MKNKKERMAELGRKSKGPNKLRNVSTSLAVRKRCNSECLVYPCIHASLTQTDEKGNPLPKGKAKCAVRNMDPKVRRRLARLLMNGEKGFTDEIKRLLLYAADIIDKGDLGDVERYMALLLKAKPAIFGEDKVINRTDVMVVNFQWAKPVDEIKKVDMEIERIRSD